MLVIVNFALVLLVNGVRSTIQALNPPGMLRGVVVRKEHPSPDQWLICIRTSTHLGVTDSFPVSKWRYRRYKIGQVVVDPNFK
jgi:hypothetical protein